MKHLSSMFTGRLAAQRTCHHSTAAEPGEYGSFVL
jgi:hypothetical protein